MSTRLAILIFSPLVILLSVGSIAWRVMSSPPVETKPYASLGERLATECAERSFQNITVLETSAEEGTPVMLEQEAFFKKAEKLGITVDERLLIHTDPGTHQKGLAMQDFEDVIDDVRSDVLVSFIGHPLVEEEDLSRFNAMDLPTIVAVSRSQKRIHRLIEETDSTAFLILPRFTFPSPISGVPDSDDEWFAKYFQIIENEEDLPLKSREIY